MDQPKIVVEVPSDSDSAPVTEISSPLELGAELADLIQKTTDLHDQLDTLYQRLLISEEFEFHSFQLQMCSQNLGSVLSKLIVLEEST